MAIPKTIFHCGGKFSTCTNTNGTSCIIKHVGDDGILSPPVVSCEGDENWEAFNAELAACGSIDGAAVDANVDFSELISFFVSECLSIKNCDGEPLSVQLDLSNLDPDGDGLINVEGDVNANVNLQPIIDALAGCLTFKACDGETIPVEIDWTGLADVCLSIKNCPDAILNTADAALADIANQLLTALEGCLKFETCDGEPLPVAIDGVVAVEGTVELGAASIAALSAAIAAALQSVPVSIDNDCTNPVPIATCPDNPLEVTLVNTPADVVAVDSEFVCNDATGFYDLHQITTTNGVAAAAVVTPTSTPCDQPVPDFEQVRVCRSGFVNIVTNQIAADGTQTEISAVATTEACGVEVTQCWSMPGSFQVSSIGGDTANTGSGGYGTYDPISTGTNRTITNPLTTDLCITHVKFGVHSVTAADGVSVDGQLVLAGGTPAVTNIPATTSNGTALFELSSRVTIAPGDSAPAVFSTVNGSSSNLFHSSYSYSSNPFIDSPEPLTLYCESEDAEFKVIGGQAFDSLGNQVDFNPNGDWEQIECVSDEAKELALITGLLSKQVESEKCYKKVSACIDTNDVFDSGEVPMTTDLLLTFNDFCDVTNINLDIIDNRADSTQTPFFPATFEVTQPDGTVQTLQPRDGDGGYPVGELGGFIRTDYFLDPVQFSVSPGDTVRVHLVGGPVDPDIQWAWHTDSDNGQAAFDPAISGQFPIVRVEGTGFDRFIERTYCDGTTRLFDDKENEITEIPRFAVPAPCDCACDCDCNSNTVQQDCVWVPIGNVSQTEAIVGEFEPIAGAAGNLADGTPYTAANLDGDPIIFGGDAPGDIRWEQNSLIGFGFGGEVAFRITPTQGTDVGNPIIWQVQANQPDVDAIITEGQGPWTYTQGALDAGIDTTGGLTALSTLSNPNAVNANEDWGDLSSPSVESVTVRGADNEAMRFEAAPLSFVASGTPFPAIQCPETGEIRNAITGETVTDVVAVPDTVGTINYCIADPNDPDSKLQVFRRVLSNGTYGPQELLTDIAPDAMECC